MVVPWGNKSVLTPEVLRVFHEHMSMRLFVSLCVSVILHAAILAQPIMIIAKRALEENHVVPVRLVNIPEDLLEPLRVPLQSERETEQEEKTENGVSFVAEGSVAVGYLDRLKVKIFRAWEYPEDAVMRGEEGKVKIEFVLNENGELVDMSILKSSGSKSLDTAAVEAVRKAAPFGPLEEVDHTSTLKITGVFAYMLD